MTTWVVTTTWRGPERMDAGISDLSVWETFILRITTSVFQFHFNRLVRHSLKMFGFYIDSNLCNIINLFEFL
jgi:hypothetical protein